MSDPQSPQAQLISDAFEIANAAAISTIEAKAVKVTLLTRGESVVRRHAWWDTRLMLDPARHPAPVVEANQQVIRYALAAGLVHAQADEPHLVRVVGR